MPAHTPTLTHRYFAVGPWSIHAWASTRHPADAPVVVLVPGLGMSGRYMLPTARALAATCRVFVVDLPGFGYSSRPPRTLTIEQLADAVAAWLDHAGFDRAAFLGNSLGCQVLADLAARYPDRVDRLVLQGPTVDPDGRSVPRQIPRWVADSLREPVPLWFLALHEYLGNGPMRWLQTALCALHDPVEQKLARVRAPTLVVRGERDALVPQRWAEEVARLTSSRLVVIPGAAHAVVYSAAAKLAGVARAFLGAGQMMGPAAQARGPAFSSRNRSRNGGRHLEDSEPAPVS
jgi:pimeloyl-ACP methyl ester carboxylesterase